MKPNDYPLTRRLDLHIWKDPCSSVEVVNAKDLEALLQKGLEGYEPEKYIHLELKPTDQRVSKAELVEFLNTMVLGKQSQAFLERIEKFGVCDE